MSVPEALIAYEDGKDGVYWWPEIQEFLDRHDLPSPSRKPGIRDRKLITRYGHPGTID